MDREVCKHEIPIDVDCNQCGMEIEIYELKQAVRDFIRICKIITIMSGFDVKTILNNPTVKRVMEEDWPENAKNNYEDFRQGV